MPFLQRYPDPSRAPTAGAVLVLHGCKSVSGETGEEVMKDISLERAKNEALRFLDTVMALEARRRVEADILAKGKAAGGEFSAAGLYAFQGCRESGAVRRASLDLTRALADLRRS